MLLHPTGAEDDHEAIFNEYTDSHDHEAIFNEYMDSDVWVATHLAEFLLMLTAIAGLFVLCRALRAETRYLALLAAGAIIASRDSRRV